MKRAPTLTALKEFLETAKIGFGLREITLAETVGWSLREGALCHRSNGFFHVVGVEFDEDASQEALMLYQPQSAITGLLSCHLEGKRHYLLQARVEPGTREIAQYGPTVQSTQANYLRLHGGTSSPYIEWFTTYRPGLRTLHISMQLDLGERYLLKSKSLIVAECAPDIALAPGFVWVPVDVLAEATAEPGLLNIDLRSLLAVAPWVDDGAELSPICASIKRSLEQSPRPEALAPLLPNHATGPRRFRLKPIESLSNWSVTDRGIVEREDRQGFDVIYVQVEARGREVANWCQPLLRSRKPGHAILACRIWDGVFEVLVRRGSERGLQTGSALLPTWLRYPGELPIAAPIIGRPLLRTTESDEGGRFYHDASLYELIMIDPAAVPLEDGMSWISVAELRLLLQQSNVCSIQLRTLSSMLLGLVVETGPSV